jgi:hypothetical protein
MRDFWRCFRQHDNNKSDLSTDDFKKYFSSTFVDIQVQCIDEVEKFCPQTKLM